MHSSKTPTHVLTASTRVWVGRVVWACAAVLAVFHALLFAERLWSGQLADPVAATRWATGAVLVAVLIWLRRSGVPLLRGRRALVFWLLVLFLHRSAHPALETGTDATRGGADAALALVVLPTATAAALSLGLLLAAFVAAAFRRRGLDVPRPSARTAPAVSRVTASDGFDLRAWARPPPSH